MKLTSMVWAISAICAVAAAPLASAKAVQQDSIQSQTNLSTVSSRPVRLLSAGSSQGYSVNANGDTPLGRSIFVTCPELNGCTVIVKSFVQVGTNYGPFMVEWTICQKVDGASDIGCAVQGFAPNDTYWGGYALGNTRDAFGVSQGRHLLQLSAITTSQLYVSRWELAYFIYSR